MTQEFTVEAPLMRPLWELPPTEKIHTWQTLGDEFLQFAEERDRHYITGIGHSIGGTIILYAAIQNPKLFSNIILLDPVLLPRSYYYMWKIVKKLGLGPRLNPLAKPAMNRRKLFNSKTEMFERYRQKKVFSKFSDDSLNIYIEHSTTPVSNGQVRLKYPPEMEVDIYLSGMSLEPIIWNGLNKIEIPITILYESGSISFPASSQIKFKKIHDSGNMIEIPNYSHLFPMEAPEKVYSIIKENNYKQ